MIDHGAVPLTSFSAQRAALGTTAQIEAFAEHAGQFEEGLSLLLELDRRWGPTGDLAALAAAPAGTATTVSWETLLLLAMSEAVGVQLDLASQTVRRLDPLVPPSLQTQHVIAARLVAEELYDAGCVAVRVLIGEAVGGVSWVAVR